MSLAPSSTDDEPRTTRSLAASSMPLISTSTDTLSTHCAYLLPTLNSLLASNPNLQLLDVGCGSGRLTTDFALQLSSTQPGARVTGIDISAAILESAKFHSLARGLAAEDVRYLQGSALALPFPANSFDVVHAHQVLSHVNDPVKAIREMARVVKPGGAVFLREGDLRSVRIWPEGEIERVLKRFYEVLIRVQVEQGAVADGGARLGLWVEQARLEGSKVEAGTSDSRYDTRAKRREYAGYWPARCMGGLFAEEAIALGTESSELEEYAKAWKYWMEDDRVSMAMSHGHIIIRS